MAIASAALEPGVPLPHRPALVATSHGTADADGTAAVARLVDAVRSTRAAAGGTVVEAFVDVHGPYVDEVVAGLDGDAVVVPLLLAAGFHVKVDIARATGPWSEALASCALGPDDRLTAVLVDRLRDAGIGPADAVVLAAAGSSDDEADAAVRAQARLLEAAWGAPVHVAYGASRRPGIEDEVARLRAGGADRVAVASYLIATGHFHRKVLRAGADVVTEPLLTDADPDPRLVDLVVARYGCAASGCSLRSCTARTPSAVAALGDGAPAERGQRPPPPATPPAPAGR